ncbi:alpha-(1,3)-fucosyltransferase C-like [Daphnia carinata]|uniref:alpha-(1,3)-fucosyltransferase C-like n=1 Tax=Daphnia carinata TaxID=120202 RepID=UPI00258082D3|nr:alpha-(1,3)-fucosyltransferase C-like [Daphnia carinata]
MAGGCLPSRTIAAFWRKKNNVLASLLCCYVFVFLVRQVNVNKLVAVENHIQITANNHQETFKPLKMILYWNSFFTSKDYTFGFGQQPFINAKCPTTGCVTTDDRNLFNVSDVVIFSIQQLNLSDLPAHRFPHQRFVFYEMESPSTTDPIPLLNNRTRFGFFNLTMTYRLDSDVVNRDAYGMVVPKGSLSSAYPKSRSNGTTSLNGNYSPVNINGKKKLAAWFVSNCVTTSRREDYVRELVKYVPVDIYGNCGNLTCENQTRGREMVRDDYKFYIGFENALCTDYVTEKLMVGFFYDAVPVVRGAVNYAEFAPPHSFIDVNDFASPKQLADYLLLLNETDSLYARYFDWRRDYTVELYQKRGWCHLCQLAHDDQLPSKVYDDILTWWVDDPKNCDLPK